MATRESRRRLATSKQTRSLARPLVASTFLFRNAGKTIPLVAVIVLAVMLISGIVAMIDSIPLSIRTIYRYSQQMVGITPRGDPAQTPIIRDRIEKEAPVPLERVMVCRATGAQVRSIVGKWPFVVLGLAREDMTYYLDRMGSRGINGRLPETGKAEALISEPVARNLGLRKGSLLLGPVQDGAYSPEEVRVVGIADTDEWLMFTPIEYQRAHHFPPIDVLLVFAENLPDQAKLDNWAVKAFKGERAQVFVYQELERDTQDMFKILYKILNVVIATLVLVITLMMAMLMNIYQSQRLPEYGLLQALGYTRRQLLSRAFGETLVVVVGGWVLGLLVAYSLLLVVRAQLMTPQAFALDPLDRMAFIYTIPIPVAILAAGALTVWSRFRRFDPVSVVERRLV
ncbi:MAG TPA: FtsX-like permease family protein [Fimbriimonadaceae bacterium]|nr:FtsX-like permease family protein [Fimbriimonadaceae bacterium]HRJ97381.1 FtsX-like permease family protein [Fimbriimonadaceae bacterium]